MHVVTDLASEAVSYINIIQDICRNNMPNEPRNFNAGLDYWITHPTLLHPDECSSSQKKRIGELIWSSKGDTVPVEMVESFFQIARALLTWLDKNLRSLNGKNKKPDLFASIYVWRKKMQQILYAFPDERYELVVTIQYMPLQIIQIVRTEEISIYEQRLYQVFMPHFTDLFSKEDVEKRDSFWETSVDGIQREDWAKSLLKDDAEILKELIEKKVPLSFETFYDRELDEIAESRLMRLKGRVQWDAPVSDAPDPMKRASEMKLSGLALSGGGIRSATFNLGLLQKLSELGVLPVFDYLSTVSGGGYVGCWLTAWIRQTGSLFKVAERLDPKRSPQPHAEEVRPIRWLRMFSNYLSPNASIMSDDAWTVGMTWLRNALINQVILLLLLLSALSMIDTVFKGWRFISETQMNMEWWSVLFFSILLLLPGSLLAAAGMRTYDQEHPPQSKYNIGRSTLLAHLMVLWATISSFLVTTWFFSLAQGAYGTFYYKLRAIWLCCLVGFVCMVLLAIRGKYYVSVREKKGSFWPFVCAILFSSATSAFITLILLVLSWQLIDWIRVCGALYWNTEIHYFSLKLALIAGIPVILEVISICVVLRMVLMGKLFPDERREWWGRMGGFLHRFMLLWIVVAVCALMLPDIFRHYIKPEFLKTKLPALLGGWTAIIGFALKFAFGSKNTGDTKQSGVGAAKEILISTAPYIFMLGFLLIGSSLLIVVQDGFAKIDHLADHDIWRSLVLTILLGLLTWFLGWRVGVNEFSLHHFYKNRLVRAYLGAARRRTDRENTANTFTGFDKNDDFPLAELVTGRNYYGPYPLINTALNASIVYELDRQDRKAESFVFSPLFCGFDFSPVRSAAYTRNRIYDYAYRPTDGFSAPGGPLTGTAMAISGAAVNPNMGYHSNSGAAFLLTVFNVRLGWWMGNPLFNRWKRSDPKTGIVYLVKDLVGKSNISTDYVCLSDGGHFDNMGLYELIRRKCWFIVLGDAEEDQNASCEGLSNAIRRCYIDFGVAIDIDITDITKKDPKTGFPKCHLVIGKIHYPGVSEPGKIVYIKSTLTDKTPVDIREYAINNHEFPQQSTADQFFDEIQFESYRKLGYTSLDKLGDLKIKIDDDDDRLVHV